MEYYAALATSERSRTELRRWRWKWLLSAAGPTCAFIWDSTDPVALDNGAYSYHLKGIPFDDEKFHRALERFGPRAEWIVVPDKVGDADASMEMAEKWMPKLEGLPLLMCMQDGMELSDMEHWLPKIDGIFLGGSTAYKLRGIKEFTKPITDMGKRFHVGRVNTIKRIQLCQWHGVTSIDGSGVSRWTLWAETINNWLLQDEQQQKLFGGISD